MIDKNLFAERLICLRNQKGVMAKDVAQAINITKQAISVYEGGKGLPTVEKLVELANHLQVSLDYLLGRSDDPTIHSPRQVYED